MSPKSWILFRKINDLNAFGYNGEYHIGGVQADNMCLFDVYEIYQRMDLLQLAALILGIILVKESIGGELLNVASILSLFEAVSYTGDSVRDLVSALDRSERMLYRGMVGKEFAVEVVHRSEIAMTFSVLFNFFLGLSSVFFGFIFPFVRDLSIRMYHFNLLSSYMIGYVEKAFNYKLAAVISLLVETLFSSGRVSDRTAILFMSTGFTIRVIKLITVLCKNSLYCHLSSASCLYGTAVGKKILDGIAESKDKILSGMYFSNNYSRFEHLESAIVSRLSIDSENGKVHVENELVESVNELSENCMEVAGLKVSTPVRVANLKYDTSDLPTPSSSSTTWE